MFSSSSLATRAPIQSHVFRSSWRWLLHGPMLGLSLETQNRIDELEFDILFWAANQNDVVYMYESRPQTKLLAVLQKHTENEEVKGRREMAAASASFRWLLQLHKDVPKAAKFYSQGLDFSVNICTLRWAELQSGPLKLALMQSPSNNVMQNGYSSLLSFTVNDINSTVTKLMALGDELDGPIKCEINGKVAAMPCDAVMVT